MVARDVAHATCIAATVALLARVAARRGEQVTAVAHWTKAAAAAMGDGNHLLALRVGQQLGHFGAAGEGNAIVDAACAAMRRPRAVVLQELEGIGGREHWPAAATVTGASAGAADAAYGAGLARTPVAPPGESPVTRAARPSTPGRRVIG